MYASAKQSKTNKSSTISRSNAAKVQTRLKVGASNDSYEKEADHVADQVVKQDQQAAQNSTAPITSINSSQSKPRISKLADTKTQRQAEEEEAQTKLQRQEEEEEEAAQTKLQRKGEEEEESAQTKLQTKKEARANVRDKRQFPVLNKVEKKLFEKKGQGQKLDDATRTSMEVGMGADFRDVKVHTDADAVEMNRDLKAHAFAHGKDVFFNSGKYEPETVSGKALLAHELTHVVQQGAAEQKLPDEKVEQNNSKRLQAPPEPADQKAKAIEVKSDKQRQEEIKADKSQQAHQEVSQEAALPTTAATGSAPNTAANASQENSGVAPTEDEKDANPAEKTTETEDTAKAQEPQKAKEPASHNKKSKSKNSKGKSAKGAVSKHLKKVTEAVFSSKKKNIVTLAENQKQKESPEKKLAQTEEAVVPPAEESLSQANASQVDTVDAAPQPESKEQEAKQEFNVALENAVPATLEEVDKFKEEGKGRVVGEAVKGVVSQDTQAVKSTYQEIDNTPEPAAPAATPQALPEMEVAPETPALALGDGVVGEVTAEHTDMSDFEAESDSLLEKEGISQEQLDMVDEGELAEANSDRKAVKNKSKDAPAEVKQFEQSKKQEVDQQLQQEENAEKQAMQAKRQQALTGAQQDQVQTKSKLELKRQQVTDHINGIYQKTNETVKQKLENLETQSLKAFDEGEKQATAAFESNVERRINAFKRRRYDRIGGSLLWAKDKLFGMDELPEVKGIFDSEKANFITRIDGLVTNISAENKRVIQECKDLVAAAKVEIEKYVAGLGPELQEAGQTALTAMTEKLDALDQEINEKQKQLEQKLAEKREAAIQAIEEKIEQMKEEMSGLVSKIGNLLAGAMMKFFKWALKKAGLAADQLMAVINKGKSVITKIVGDPIGFIGNLIKAVKKGIGQFATNIKTHLVSGLVSWLTGAMSDVPIQLPQKFDLKGIFSLVLQILGLTWERIRTKLVKRLGERVVRIAEVSIDIVKRVVIDGPIALWEMIKEKAAEIKTQVMEGIRNWVIINVIKQGIIKLVSFLNPAGAILQAIIAIYNTVMFFVENAQRLVQFVKSIFDSIGNIAMGKLSAAASYVEKVMGMTIPIIMNFLARLLGLSGIGKAISNVIKKIRKPIDKVVDRVIDTVVKKAKSLFKKGKTAVKNAKDALVQWWKVKKKFKAADGHQHSLYLKGQGSAAVLTVASNPTPFASFIQSVEAKTDEQKSAKTKALDKAKEVDAKKKEPLGGNKDQKKQKEEAKQKALKKLLNELSVHTKILFGVNGDLPQSEIHYQSANKGGALMGTKMAANVLTKNGPTGSVPTQANHTVFDKLNLRRNGSGSYYIRGHLLNHNTSGPGEWKNMTPLSREGNKLHEQVAESKVKAAVHSGAVVSYTVTPKYTRSNLTTPADADDKVKTIRSVEKFVPTALMVKAAIMKADNVREKQQTLVSEQAIPNPIDTSIGSYQTDSVAKQPVNLSTDSATHIAENTDLTVAQASLVKSAIGKLTEDESLNYYTQLSDKEPALVGVISGLRDNPKVKLK